MEEAPWFASREERLKRFLARLDVSTEEQSAVQNASSPQEICKISERLDTPIGRDDLVLFYRDLEQHYFPWHGMPMQKRREFIHEDGFKG
ncbi:hypothetical protein NZK27_02305 [Synechococcus sp. FGCU-3]|nr:hypothetical protein [Synechococcus sp. FGCU3]